MCIRDSSKIHAFKDHPFKVLDDEKMTDLVESVKAKGVLTPVLLRPDGEDGYEMISGHRRMYAAVRAGLETIPAIVRELSDDDAVIAMVDANIQREELLPSEKDVYKRQCYTYIKEIVKGESYIELAEEEKESLERAIFQEAYDIRDAEFAKKKNRK